MIASIQKLREISERCLAGEPLGDDLADWLGRSLDGFLDRRYQTIEEAVGLIFAQGGIPWWREEAIRARDAALRELAERFYRGLSAYKQAQKISTIALRYAASAWRHDLEKSEFPDYYPGTVKEYLWRAFKSGATMPLCERQVRNILAR